MLEIDGDLFAQKCDAICIPTNGALDTGGRSVMGAGVAKAAKDRFPNLPREIGKRIRMFGHAVHLVTVGSNPQLSRSRIRYHIISFPTKPSKIFIEEGWDNVLPRYRQKGSGTLVLPGWKGYANLNIIKHSSEELVELTNKEQWSRVCLPRVGCGQGGLKWSEVRDVLSPVFDDRFTIVFDR